MLSFVSVLIEEVILFQIGTPVLEIKESAIFVFALGARRRLACLVGYLCMSLFLVNRLSKAGGRRDLENLNINIPAFRV